MAERFTPESLAGTLYVYIDEEGDAIAVARNAVGPNGGWTADSIAKMAMPAERVTREEINGYAHKFAASDALYEALETLLASCSRTTPAVHDDCGTRLVTAPTVDALKQAATALAQARGEA